MLNFFSKIQTVRKIDIETEKNIHNSRPAYGCQTCNNNYATTIEH